MGLWTTHNSQAVENIICNKIIWSDFRFLSRIWAVEHRRSISSDQESHRYNQTQYLGINTVGTEQFRGFPLVISEDNKAYIEYVNNPVHHSKNEILRSYATLDARWGSKRNRRFQLAKYKYQLTEIQTKPYYSAQFRALRDQIMECWKSQTFESSFCANHIVNGRVR